MERVATLTPNPAVDVTTTVERMEPSVKLRCEPVQVNAGGGGLNASKAIAALGGTSVAVYAAGGAHGALLDELLGEGIDRRRVEIAGATRENVMVRERATGRTFRFVMPGPDLRPAEAHALLAAVEAERAPWTVGSGSLPPGAPPDLYARAVARAAAWGGRVLLDAPPEAMRPVLEGGGLFLLKCNHREFAALTGVHDPAGWRAEAAALVGWRAAEIVIVTVGPEGAVLTSDRGHREIPAHPVQPVNPTGAGDSFMGALALALARGASPEDAARFGAAAASAAMLTPGTEPCRREDAERFHREALARRPLPAAG